MDATTFSKALVLLVGGAFSISLMKIAYRVWRSDKSEYDINRRRSGKALDPIFGRIRTSHGGYRDFRVQAGLAVDTKNNVWVEQGVLSEEAVDAVLHPKNKGY